MDEKLFTCLNGSFVLAHRAAVAAADRGFRYGDGLFTTMRVERGVPFYWHAHMERLSVGLQALRIDLDLSTLQPYAKKLLLKNHAQHGFLRVGISRGVGSRGYKPHPPGMPVTWVMEWMDGLPETGKPSTLWLSSYARIPPQCLPMHAKLAQGLNSTLAAMEAQDHETDEALQLAVDGSISEASAANIFWLKDGQLFTPSLDCGCVAGVTREAILRVSPLPTRIVREGLTALQDAEAVFLTSARVSVWPVAAIEPSGQRFNTTHPIHRQMLSLLTQDRQKQLFANRHLWIVA